MASFVNFQVTKPLLERQRRARINRCLDELKDLMTGALVADGENMAKLEKADVLELTVRHLHKLRRERRLACNPVTSSDRFRAGFTQCAREVSVCLAAIPGVDVSLGTRLMTHLGHALNNLEQPTVTSTPSAYSPPITPLSDAEMLASPTAAAMSSWRPESPLSSSGYASDANIHQTHIDEEIDVGSDVDASTTLLNCKAGGVWRPW
jgi:hairy and enhancer of split, invertebrate